MPEQKKDSKLDDALMSKWINYRFRCKKCGAYNPNRMRFIMTFAMIVAVVVALAWSLTYEIPEVKIKNLATEYAYQYICPVLHNNTPFGSPLGLIGNYTLDVNASGLEASSGYP